MLSIIYHTLIICCVENCRNPLRVIGDFHVDQRRVGSDRKSRRGFHAFGEQRAANPKDTQGNSSTVQNGHEIGAQGTRPRPRQVAHRPSDTDHRKSARATGGRHH